MQSNGQENSGVGRVTAAIATYMLYVDRGEAVDREAFIRQYPEIADELRAWSVNVSRRIASPGLIDAARSRGFGVLVYTVNDPEESARLAKSGAKGVFTDYPDRVRTRAAD